MKGENERMRGSRPTQSIQALSFGAASLSRSLLLPLVLSHFPEDPSSSSRIAKRTRRTPKARASLDGDGRVETETTKTLAIYEGPRGLLSLSVLLSLSFFLSFFGKSQKAFFSYIHCETRPRENPTEKQPASILARKSELRTKCGLLG